MFVVDVDFFHNFDGTLLEDCQITALIIKLHHVTPPEVTVCLKDKPLPKLLIYDFFSPILNAPVVNGGTAVLRIIKAMLLMTILSAAVRPNIPQ